MKKENVLAKIKHIYSEEWKNTVTVFIGSKEVLVKYLDEADGWPNSKYLKEQVEETLNDKTVVGTMYPCKSASSLIWIPKWPKTPQEIASLAHEILHSTFHMLDVLEVEYRYGGPNESYTYTVEYFLRKALNPRGYREIKE